MSVFKFFDSSVDNQRANKVSDDSAAVNFKLQEGYNHRFQIETQSILFALGNKAIDIRNESVWVIQDIKINDNGYTLCVVVERHDVFNNNPSFDGVVNFSKLFNVPLQELVIKLDVFGNIVQVVNNHQVMDSWQGLKSQILPSLNTEEAALIMQNGDAQFSDPIYVLRNTLIYNLFFEPVYGLKQKGETRTLNPRTFTSQLFQNVTIPYNPVQKVDEISKNYVKISYSTETLEFDKAALVNIYNQIYKDVMDGEFNYKIGYTGATSYSVETGLIKHCLVEVIESVNDNLRFECTYKIKEI